MAFTNDWDSDVGLTPEHVFTTEIKFKTLVSRGESGKQRRRSKASGPQTWSLKFGVLVASDADLIWQFYQDCNGAYDTFAWINPVDSVAHTVRFKSDTLSRDYFQYNFYRLSFEFEEII
jgi:hypothetical protein